MSLSVTTLLVNALTLSLGILLGYHLRIQIVERKPTQNGESTDMADTDTPRKGPLSRVTRALDRPWFYIVGLFIAVALGASASYLAIQSSGAAGESADRVKALAECNTQYNIEAGAARDERALQANSDRVAERELWQTLYDQISAPEGETTTEDVLATIQARIDSIDKVTTTAIQNPYPDPDRCQ